MKRIVAIGDLHCGHLAGLTPPAFMHTLERSPTIAGLQMEMWVRYKYLIESLQPIDVLIANGDLIDGRGEKSGGTELITGDREEQCRMAIEALNVAKAKKIYISRGTPYHTGQEEDWENLIAREVNASISDHLFVDAEGVIFDIRHHVSSSSNPYGRHTAVAKDRLWNLLWEDVGNQPRANIYLRSHVHYHAYSGGPGWLAMTLPALQAPQTKFGKRCSGTVDWGVTVFNCEEGNISSWKALITRLSAGACALLKA